jgi:hypothetical protein
MPIDVGTEERARLDDDSSLLIESRLAEGVFAIISFASIIFLARALPGVLMTCKGGRSFFPPCMQCRKDHASCLSGAWHHQSAATVKRRANASLPTFARSSSSSAAARFFAADKGAGVLGLLAAAVMVVGCEAGEHGPIAVAG